MHLMASVFCAAENCWAKLSTASPKRPVWDMGEFRTTFVGIQTWYSWTTKVDIAHPRDRAVTFIARSEVHCDTEFLKNFWVVTTLVQVLQCLGLMNLQ